MSSSSKIVWTEGMFLLPQHFQQHDRYLESLVNGRSVGLQPYGWGIYSMAMDGHMLEIGKVGLSACQGVFPDGTPFHMPEDDVLPLPADVPEDVSNETFYLALPVRQPGTVETDTADNREIRARFRLSEQEVKDSNRGADGLALLQTGDLKARLMMEREDRSGFTCLALGKVMEVGTDKTVVLDDQFIPPCTNCFAIMPLAGFMRQLLGLLNARGATLASRLADPAYGSVAEVTDFLALQMVNRYQPMIDHLLHVEGFHPEGFYRIAVQMAGELSTFYREGRRPSAFPAYDHENLKATFTPVMEELRRLLQLDTIQRVIQIPLTKSKYGIYGARTPDANLLDNAVFVLSAKADVPSDALRNLFPPQVKIAPAELIQQLVRSHLPGIPIDPMPVAPRQLPLHAGYTYFELNRHSDMWKKMKSSAGFAIYIGGDFPGLKMELWAIREG